MLEKFQLLDPAIPIFFKQAHLKLQLEIFYLPRSSLLFTCRLKVSVNAAFNFPSTFSHSPFLPFPRTFFSPSSPSLSLTRSLTFFLSLRTKRSRFLLLRLGQLLAAATTLLSTGSSRWQGTAKGTKMYSE